MASSISFHRNLIVITMWLVILQIFLAGVLGYKPSFDAGYYVKPVAVTSSPVNSASLSRERQRELEALLSPVPDLKWSSNHLDLKSPQAQQPTDLAAQHRQSLADAESRRIESRRAQRKKAQERQAQQKQTPSKKLEVKQVYFQTLPDLKDLSVHDRKEQFVASILPLIIRANVELDERRRLIELAASEGDIDTLNQWAELYRLKLSTTDIENIKHQLLHRVDEVPVSLALAQAAIESGWGVSRFAVEGNALYGQWAWSSGAGIRPRQSQLENVVIRSFPNIFESVRAYMHNLNTHLAYADFRLKRAQKPINVTDLTATLRYYSQEREAYVEKLNLIIEKNNFQQYDDAELQQN